ncbi:MAG: hypothetical protein ABW352_07810 [Polyangiales bacterium]
MLWASGVEAQTEWQEHARVWFGADFALAPVGRYDRELDVLGARGRDARGGSLAVSAAWVGVGPLGIGAHVAPTMTWVGAPGIDARVFTVDVGVDPMARLAWPDFELTCRLPIGFTTGRLNWLRTVGEQLVVSNANSDLGFGMHVGPLLGALFWLSDWVGIRIESGLLYRRMKFDEGERRSAPGEIEVGTLRGDVLHNSLAWTLSVGFVRRLNPASLPDENGPPLPTPDFYPEPFPRN